MTETVPLVHPAPLLCRHRTPGQARVDFVQVTTPVRLREGDASAFERATPPQPGERHVAYVHGGFVWIGENCTVEALTRQMANPTQGLRAYHEILTQALVRTPLVALWPDGPGRGEPLGIRKVRTVVRDYTERARAEVVAYLDRNIRIVEGQVFRRCSGPLALHSSTHVTPAFKVDLGLFRFLKGNGMVESQHVVAPRADQVEAFWDFEKAFYLDRRPGKLKETFARMPARLDPRGLDGHLALGDANVDLLAFACDAPSVLLRNLSPGAFDVPEIREAAERLHHWTALGQIGAINHAEAEAATIAVCDLVDVLRTQRAGVNLHIGMDKLGTYGREIALPRLRGSFEPVPDEDEIALAGFRI